VVAARARVLIYADGIQEGTRRERRETRIVSTKAPGCLTGSRVGLAERVLRGISGVLTRFTNNTV